MYTSIQSSQRWNSTIPTVCFLLLSLIFLTGAATVIISFVSIYLPSRNVDSVSTKTNPLKQIPTTLNENIPTQDSDSLKTKQDNDQESNKRQKRADSTTAGDTVTGDIPTISQYWGNLRPYADNSDDTFGVKNVGVPNGCQVEQVFIYHRHAARFPGNSEKGDLLAVTQKLTKVVGYTGPLSFLNTYQYDLGAEDLVPEGTAMAYQSGVDAWQRYGRILYNALVGQNYYNATGQKKPVIRCNTIGRVTDTTVAWAEGFFTLYNASDKYTLVAIPAAPGLNNTLASYYSCLNFFYNKNGAFDLSTALFIPIDNYLKPTVQRLQPYAPNVNLTTKDVYLMQELCAYEYITLGSSGFCLLFTLNEWINFEYTYDLFTYYGFSFAAPSGRAQGLGFVQELIARLQNQTITTSNSSVNTSYDGDPNLFPSGQKFYFEGTHDFMIVAMLTALSFDYFRENLSYSSFPPPPNRHFKTSQLVPFAARLVYEKIGCSSANPVESNSTATFYNASTYGYSASNAPYKFIRMRLNTGILPIDTIRGGFCSGRSDGLCPVDKFIASQANVTAQANYAYECFGNFTYNASLSTNDGNYFFS